MNCYNHPMQVAVAQCSDCGKGLCHECATAYTITICNSCNSKRIHNERVDIFTELVVTFAFGIVLAYLNAKYIFFDGDHSPSVKSLVWYYIFSVYTFSGIVAGWKTLTRLTPSVFLILPILGWLIYFVLKLFLSFWLGLIMLPIRTIRNIYRLVALQKISV